MGKCIILFHKLSIFEILKGQMGMYKTNSSTQDLGTITFGRRTFSKCAKAKEGVPLFVNAIAQNKARDFLKQHIYSFTIN